MIGAEGLLALAVAALLVITIAAMYVRGIARVFLIAQVAYWGLSYVARPVVLLWVQPEARFADNIADPRLANIGYEQGLTMVLQPVAFGLWVYAVVVVVYALWRRGRGDDPAGSPLGAGAGAVPTFMTVYVIGTLGRVVAYVSGSAGAAGDIESSNAFLSFVAQLATAGTLGLIIFYRPADRRTRVLALGTLLFLELLWTVAVQSKTPIMGAALAVAVRFALDGWTKRRVAAIVAVAIGGIGGFGWLQALKQPAEVRSASAIVDSQYPALVQPFLSILRRFDLLEAATDAYYMAGRPWLSLQEVLRYSVESFVPAQLLGSEKFRSGTAWASQVRGSSVDMTQVSVSLADGNINEGYVLGGYVGVVVGVLFTFGLLLFAVRTLHARHILPIAFGLALTESPVLFERGILGSMEVVGKSLQGAILLWVIDSVVRELRKRAPARLDAATRDRDSGAPVGDRMGNGQWG
jgi:hypothetical protein